MATVYVGLGTNLGDRQENLSKAIDLISTSWKITIIKKSSVKETDPVDYLDQPAFLNQIILIDTSLQPEELLKYLNKIETDMGREKIIPRGPRIIDLDILLYDSLIYNTEKITIPHPEIKKRLFIVEHLVELDKEIVDPLTGLKYSDVI